MGCEIGRINIVPLGTTCIDFESFDVENCMRFQAEDKARLPTAIEGALGTSVPPNSLVRTLLTSASGDPTPAHGTYVRRDSCLEEHKWCKAL
jgi:hypothetical protein